MLSNEVQEIQGLYGLFNLSERVLQKIWLRGDFNQANLRTESGMSLEVIEPGRWNSLEGPDFLGACLKLNGKEHEADVEVHFHASDWNLHRHDVNPNFSKVRLHVVLYSERGQRTPVYTQKGEQPELLYLMPLLNRDLEEYAMDDALIELEETEDSKWIRRFLGKPIDRRQAFLKAGAQLRWQVKVDLARKRLHGASWSELCHEYCLEVLGYSRNRGPMSQIALKHSLNDFALSRIDVEAVFERLKDQWKLSGLRPANHPLNRLVQYQGICEISPNWPDALYSLLESFTPAVPCKSGADFRKAHLLSQKLEEISVVMGGGIISTKRLNTLICDALLPLATAKGLFDASEYWSYWPTGDCPDVITRFIKKSGLIDRQNPFSNGHLQGALQFLLVG